MTTTRTDWRAVAKATLTSRRADCGHRIPAKSTVIWFGAARVGSNTEVWTNCRGCRKRDDYVWHIYSEDPPTRIRPETL